MIVVKLGKTQREAHVHRRLLQSRSPYFYSILEDRHVKTSRISLYDVEADIFFAFLSWLYADCFVPPRRDDWLGLCKLWLAAERFQVIRDVKSNIEPFMTNSGRKVPALQNKVFEVFSCRLYQREVDGLDLEIFHYVYDNTGPGSMLRKVFAHIALSYGRQDAFAQMRKDMPPVFHADYAAQHAARAQKWEEQITIDDWDLTGFLLPELVVTKGENSAEVKTDTEQDCRNRDRHGGPVDERDIKRKRTRE
jgi:hypothetical protein